ncbi:FMN-dependent NADH-azoreductase [Promicromonospora thailandica]|uniref:FMN dependent NADH:quinone oxidoreductase n=1 Tax=Promicromonospora thailandica TaxID=765201 RepID=A0A9X2G8E4_9MICO|nr:NAD(P)H-dependent oxidoreductase [Promicromonospora thailandica]MCP2263796.1 FMN-dependent NADH-azoreductase [Promicromonospora thailandica]BFF17915.1 NAD(P)H-dependent oxidoreductase [Promicromonospora thailandica]
MATLLHIDASIQGDSSVSRQLTARAAAAWRAAHPDGSVTYRDLAADPVPHFDTAANLSRGVPLDEHTPEQARSWARMEQLTAEVAAADTVVLGLPIYNFGAPSTVKAWLDHLIAPGLGFDPDTRDGLLGTCDFVVLVSRGGGYAEGTPRHGWDHASAWLPHGLSLVGIEPRFITTELTLASSTPAMSGLVPLAEESRRQAEAEIDDLWAPAYAGG